MAIPKDDGNENLTIRLDRQTIQRAKILAARRSTSVDDLIARQIEALAGEEETYEQSARQ
jgi:hypothetical protein